METNENAAAETYWLDLGTTKVYYHVTGDNTVAVRGKSITISRQRLLDFLATARELGHKTGKL